jgi:protein gp37
LKWARQANGRLRRPRVFCASLADVFDNRVPKEWRLDLWHLITQTPELDWLLLTKRPENIAKMIPWRAGGEPWSNVWLGTTAEDAHHFHRRWDVLRLIPATVKFISYEPALGPLILSRLTEPQPDWIICGGESGHGARFMDPEWARYIRDQCRGRRDGAPCPYDARGVCRGLRLVAATCAQARQRAWRVPRDRQSYDPDR